MKVARYLKFLKHIQFVPLTKRGRKKEFRKICHVSCCNESSFSEFLKSEQMWFWVLRYEDRSDIKLFRLSESSTISFHISHKSCDNQYTVKLNQFQLSLKKAVKRLIINYMSMFEKEPRCNFLIQPVSFQTCFIC